MKMLWGLLFGAAYAVGDGMLFYWVMRRALAQKEAAGRPAARGMAARALLTLAVVVLALLLPFMDAAGVVAALLVQKAVLALFALVHSRK